MKRLRWTEHAGKKILRMDVLGAKREEQLELLTEYSAMLRGEPDGSVRLLVVAGPIEFHSDIAVKAKGVLLGAQPKILRSALVGVEGIFKVTVESFYTVARLLGMNVHEDRGHYFDTEDEAKAWLAQK
jgi:hypothetical protein